MIKLIYLRHETGLEKSKDNEDSSIPEDDWKKDFQVHVYKILANIHKRIIGKKQFINNSDHTVSEK